MVHALFVLPSHWGKGVAPLLLEAGVSLIKATGSKEAKLWTLEKNTRARAFYEKRGWKLDGRTRVAEFPPHPMDVGYALDLTA